MLEINNGISFKCWYVDRGAIFQYFLWWQCKYDAITSNHKTIHFLFYPFSILLTHYYKSIKPYIKRSGSFVRLESIMKLQFSLFSSFQWSGFLWLKPMVFGVEIDLRWKENRLSQTSYLFRFVKIKDSISNSC